MGVAVRELAELVPACPFARRWIAVVDEERHRPRRAEEPRRVPRRIASGPLRVHRLLGRLAVEELREVADRPPVRQRRRNVAPLARVAALGEEAAELVERRNAAEDAVRVRVDELHAQYFRKWPRCSNASSPSEYAVHSERRTAR